MKSFWTKAPHRLIPSLPGGELARSLRIRILILIILALLSALAMRLAAGKMETNRRMVRMIRHHEKMSRQRVQQERIHEQLTLFFLKAANNEDLEAARTRRMEELVRRLRDHGLDILAFRSRIRESGADVSLELSLSVAGNYPDLVAALDGMTALRPAWLADEYRIQLAGSQKVRMDGVFRMPVRKEH